VAQRASCECVFSGQDWRHLSCFQPAAEAARNILPKAPRDGGELTKASEQERAHQSMLINLLTLHQGDCLAS